MMTLPHPVTSLVALTLLLGCGDDSMTGGSGQGGAGPTSTQSGQSSSTDTTTTSGAGGAACNRQPLPADRERQVVVGHPYDTSLGADGLYEVLTLSTSGELTATGQKFVMGRPADQRIVFTPDSELGFAVQNDGSIGVFRFDNGVASVATAALSGMFYADSLTMSTDGQTLYVVDPNFPENGGGLYAISIGCDGTLTEQPRLFESKSAKAFFELPNGEALIAARGAFGSTPTAHAHRLTLGPAASKAAVDLFGDDDAIISWAAITRNGQHLLVGENSAFSGVPNRVGSASLANGTLAAAAPISGIEDPYALATSPFDDVALVVSGFGDSFFVLDYNPGQASAFTLQGELAGASPQLPGALAMVERGSLDGLMLIAEVRGLYQLRFAGGGSITDGGVFALGAGNGSIVVGVGLTP